MTDVERARRLNQLLEAALETDIDCYQFAMDATREEPDLRQDLLDMLQVQVPTRFFREQPNPELSHLLAAQWQKGYRLGAYELEEELAQGGMGAVYRARRADDSFEKKVAIKIMRPSLYSPETLTRFHEERQILARLEHPHIARLLDGGATPEGIPYLVMEYIEGLPLIDYCEKHHLPLDTRLSLFQDLCQAVTHAHHRLIAHRDLKPDNILVTPEGRLKLLDFGIARILEGRDDLLKTRTGQRPMSPLYASPEQVMGREITTATDLYSLGVILFQLCSGSLPYELQKDSIPDLTRIIVDRPPLRLLQAFRQASEQSGTAAEHSEEAFAERWRTSPKQLHRQLKGDLEAIVLKCLEKNPTHRYASIEGLSSDLKNFRQNLPISAARYNAGTILLKLMSRHKFITGTVVLFLLLSLNFTVQLGFKNKRIEQERDRARQEQARSEATTQFIIELFKRTGSLQDKKAHLSPKDLLELAQEDLDSGNTSDPLDRAMYYKLLAGIQHSLGNYEKAHDLFAAALTYLEGPGVGTPEDRIFIYLDLSRTSQEIGNYDEAEHWMRKGINLYQTSDRTGSKSLGLVSLGSIPILHGFNDVYYLNDQHPQVDASKFETKALITRNLNSLGIYYFLKEDYSRAQTFFEEALEISQQASSKGNPDLTSSMINLGMCLSILGQKGAEAEKLLKDALHMNRKLFPNDQVTATTLHSLAAHFIERDAFSQARQTLEAERDLVLKEYGPGDPSLVANYHLLGKVHQAQSQERQAIKYYKQALLLYDSRPGILYKNIAELINNLKDLESKI